MTSTLDLTGEEEPVTGTGHGTRALGPSDSSDSGSDVVGGPGMDEGLSDEQARRMPLSTTQGAGRDLGDADLDADSDRSGTGERGSAGPDGSGPVDQQTSMRPGIESASDELDDPDAVGPDADATQADAPEADAAADDVEAVDDDTAPGAGSASVSDGAT